MKKSNPKQLNKSNQSNNITGEKEVRLDKWLWAARFFKTRSMATDAIKGGKIHIDGARVKPSKLAQLNQIISISKNQEYFEVIILNLSDHRQSAPIAQTLYQETEKSIEQREKHQQLRKLSHQVTPNIKGRPTKKDRREMSKFTDI